MLDQNDWQSIQGYIGSIIKLTQAPIFSQDVVVKADPIRNLVWLTEFGNQPIPVFSHHHKVTYWDTQVASGELQREAFVIAQQWGVTNNSSFNYEEVRPIPYNLKPFDASQTIVTDCSGWFALAAKWAGLIDPTGNKFNGQGNTDSLVAACRKITQANADIGDGIIYWNKTTGVTHHIAGIVEVLSGGTDFNLVNFSTDGEPINVLHSVKHASQTSEGYPDLLFINFLPCDSPNPVKREAKIEVECPKVGDIVLVARMHGSRRLPKCLGILQSRDFVVPDEG